MRMPGSRLCPFAAIIVLCAFLGLQARGSAPSGIVVEAVGARSASERAGLAPGDRLVSWEGPAPKGGTRPEGLLDTPLELAWAEVECAPLPAVTLRGFRGRAPRTWTLGPGRWGIRARPQLDGEPLLAYEEALACLQEHAFPAGMERFRHALALVGCDFRVRIWMSCRLAEQLALDGDWEQAELAIRETVADAEVSGSADLLSSALRACALAAAQAGEQGLAADLFARLWLQARGAGRGGVREADALLGLGEACLKLREYSRAGSCLLESLEFYRRVAPGSYPEAQVLSALGVLYRRMDRLADSEPCHRGALSWYEGHMPRTSEASAVKEDLALVLRLRGDLDGAELLYQDALKTRQELLPESMDEAWVWNGLGLVAEERGDLDLALARHSRSLDLMARLSPGSLEVAASYNNAGIVNWKRSDLAEAERYFRLSLAIRQSKAPESPGMANTWNNLGMIAELRGDLAGAEDWYRKSLQLRLRLAPRSFSVAGSRSNLGNLAFRRKDWEGARKEYFAALDINRSLAPGGMQESICLNNLGLVAKERGDAEEARRWLSQALAIRERGSPRSLETASSLAALASAEGLAGNLDEAFRLFERSREIRHAAAPGGLDESVSLDGLGQLARRAGDSRAARGRYLEALAIRELRAPESLETAVLLHELATLAREGGDRSTARDYLRRAVDILESQRRTLGGGRAAAERFSGEYTAYYDELVDLLLEEGLEAEAFDTLEKGRARLFLRMLAERDLDFSRDAPPGLLEERRSAIVAFERAQTEVGRLSERDPPEAQDAAFDRLRRARADLDSTLDILRRASPRMAELQSARPIPLADLRERLPEGLLLLSFSVGSERSHLFALSHSGLAVFPLAVGRAVLGREVRALRARASDPEVPPSSVLAAGKSLFDRILAPASGMLRPAQILVFCPGSPLHALPFDVLSKDGRVFLGTEWATSTTLSATLLAQSLEGSDAPWGQARLEAFGDPAYPAPGSRSTLCPVLQKLFDRGQLAPLPASREELGRIREPFGDRADLRLGAQATEGAAKAVGRRASHLHFACHGFLDDAHPLESGLALSLPPRCGEAADDGFLQGWEVLESVRVDADLVVLSACRTALGEEVPGEGLLGLARAFQYAGGRSVVASLWSIRDDATAILMGEFYTQLGKGVPAAEALRLAKVRFLKGRRSAGDPDYSHPFYWAAFQLQGAP